MTAPRFCFVAALVIAIGACVAPDGPDGVREGVVTGAAPERLFLQQVSHRSAIVKWRGDARAACVSPAGAGLKSARCVDAVGTDSNHWEALFSDLSSDTEYVYSVGGHSSARLRFRTAPIPGQLPADGNVHIWIVGDSGTAAFNEVEARQSGMEDLTGPAQVLAGFQTYQARNNSKPADMMVMLGDNAYMDGTDAQWQVAVFDMFGEVLSQAPLWSTIGNHEMGLGAIDMSAIIGSLSKEDIESIEELLTGGDILSMGGASRSSDPNSYYSTDNPTPRRIPYLEILTLPENGELGGVPSGTEQYYSFDHGNVHIVSLDSQLTARDAAQRADMKQWLIADLENNEHDWTIVIFHHPVYTKASHDSDTAAAGTLGFDQPILDLRTEFTPVFEQYGVDLTFSGHSHSYERSWYLRGHRGDSDSFDAHQHAELNAAGKPAIGHGDEAYQQISVSSQRDDRVVYTVAGSSGHVTLGHGKLNHPANAVQENDPQGRHGLEEMGSVVVDASKNELVARFINEKGNVLDTVIVRRD